MMHARKGLVCASDQKFWRAAAYERTSLRRKDLQYLTDQLSPVVMDLFVNVFFCTGQKSHTLQVLLPTPLRIFQSFQSSINVFHYNSLLMPNPYPNKPFYVKKTQSLCFWLAEDN